MSNTNIHNEQRKTNKLISRKQESDSDSESENETNNLEIKNKEKLEQSKQELIKNTRNEVIKQAHQKQANIKQAKLTTCKVVESEIKPQLKTENKQELILYLPVLDNIQYTMSENATKNSSTETDKEESDDMSNKHASFYGEMSQLVDDLKRKDVLIMSLKTKLKEKYLANNNNMLIKDKIEKVIDMQLIKHDKNKLEICEQTDICCWWCTYNFDTVPLFLPDRFYNKVYYVFGNFCSFSCMLAYNENMNDHKKNVRRSLIAQLYNEIFKSDTFRIKPSPQRELLEKFGGPLNIDNYRDAYNVISKTFKLTLPPMIPLLSNYEETNHD